MRFLNIPPFLIPALILAGCGSPSPATGPIEAVVPFHIKANDRLGIRLGMKYADFRATHPHKNGCRKEDRDGETECSIFTGPRSDAATVAGASTSGYRLTFYRGKLIGIEYDILSYRVLELPSILASRFGPAKHEKGVDTYVWTNPVSSITLELNSRDISIAQLKLKLDKENAELTDKTVQRETKESCDDL